MPKSCFPSAFSPNVKRPALYLLRSGNIGGLHHCVPRVQLSFKPKDMVTESSGISPALVAVMLDEVGLPGMRGSEIDASNLGQNAKSPMSPRITPNPVRNRPR